MVHTAAQQHALTSCTLSYSTLQSLEDDVAMWCTAPVMISTVMVLESSAHMLSATGWIWYGSIVHIENSPGFFVTVGGASKSSAIFNNSERRTFQVSLLTFVSTPILCKMSNIILHNARWSSKYYAFLSRHKQSIKVFKDLLSINFWCF